MPNMQVSKAGEGLLRKINAADLADPSTLGLRGGQKRALGALKRAGLVAVKPIEVNALVLTKEGEELLGKGRGAHAGRRTGNEHRRGSKVAQAVRLCEKFHGKIARGDLVAKIAKQCGLSEASASTYIHNWVKTTQ